MFDGTSGRLRAAQKVNEELLAFLLKLAEAEERHPKIKEKKFRDKKSLRPFVNDPIRNQIKIDLF